MNKIDPSKVIIKHPIMLCSGCHSENCNSDCFNIKYFFNKSYMYIRKLINI